MSKINYSVLESWIDKQVDSGTTFKNKVQAGRQFIEDANPKFDILVDYGRGEVLRSTPRIKTLFDKVTNSSLTKSNVHPADRDEEWLDRIQNMAVVAESNYLFDTTFDPNNAMHCSFARTFSEYGSGGKALEKPLAMYFDWTDDVEIHGHDSIDDQGIPVEQKSETATRKSSGYFCGNCSWGQETEKTSSLDRIKKYDRDNPWICMSGRDPVTGQAIYVFRVRWSDMKEYLLEQFEAKAPRLRSNHWMSIPTEKVEGLYCSVPLMYINRVERNNFNTEFFKWVVNEVFNLKTTFTEYTTSLIL